MPWMWIKRGIFTTIEVLNILQGIIEIEEQSDKEEKLVTQTITVI